MQRSEVTEKLIQWAKLSEGNGLMQIECRELHELCVAAIDLLLPRFSVRIKGVEHAVPEEVFNLIRAMESRIEVMTGNSEEHY